MTLEHTNAYSEVYAILKLMEEEYVNRVPKKIRTFFEEERNFNYEPTYNPSLPLEKQHLRRETVILLSILSLNYWCDSKEEKQEYLRQFSVNEIERRKIKENYNIEEVIEKNNELNVTSDEVETKNNVDTFKKESSNEFKRVMPKESVFGKIGKGVKSFINNAFIGDESEDGNNNNQGNK